MADKMTNDGHDRDGWHVQNFSREYVSCIKIHGRPILPPLMTEERREEMRQLKAKALEIEVRLNSKKSCQIAEDAAGGEALYEGSVEELHFASSLPTSLAEHSEDIVEETQIVLCKADVEAVTDVRSAGAQTERLEAKSKVLLSSAEEDDMLKQFDPYAPVSRLSHLSAAENAPDNVPKGSVISEGSKSSVLGGGSEGHWRVSATSSSADSSAALSNSTDLNNYMDVTESSVDVSVMRSESRIGTATTSSTLQPDSDSPSVSGQDLTSKQDGKTTYEDLNNYLDIILNNSSDSSQYTSNLDCTNKASVTAMTSMDTEFLKLRPSSPPQPLKEPSDGLQSRIYVGGGNSSCESKSDQSSPHDRNGNLKNNKMPNESSFLDQCALSPVLHNEDTPSTYEQKVQLYLQNIMAGQITLGTFPETNTGDKSFQSSRAVQNLEHEVSKGPCGRVASNAIERDGPLCASDDPEGQPRLVRSNSYTLDSPSPLLLAHMEAELRKNSPNKPPSDNKKVLIKHRVRTTSSSAPSRKIWDVDKAKNMPSWCNRQNDKSITAASQSKKESIAGRVTPKKRGPYQSLPTSATGSSEKVEGSGSKTPKTRTVTQKSNVNSPKSNTVSKGHTGAATQAPSIPPSVAASLAGGTCLPDDVDEKEKLRLLLSELQLQHTREMEELLNRQRKEQEAIRIALLQKQNMLMLERPTTSPVQYLSVACNNTSETISQRLSDDISTQISNSSNHGHLMKDSLQMERRNTSPSIYENKSIEELQNCLLQYHKSSSISLDDVTASNSNSHLVIESEGSIPGNNTNAPTHVGQFLQVSSDMNVGMEKIYIPVDSLTSIDRSLAISSFNVGSGINSLPSTVSAVRIQPGAPSSLTPPSCLQTDNLTVVPGISSHNMSSNQEATKNSSVEASIIALQAKPNFPSTQNKNVVYCEQTVINAKPLDLMSSSMPGLPSSLAFGMLSSALPTTCHVPPGMSASLPSSAMMLAVTGSPRARRKAWCSRQLFLEDADHNADSRDWILQTWEKRKHLAASKIQAGVRGYLTRRLLRTERVQNCITTIRDTIVCALQLQRDCTLRVEERDLQLHGRLIQQLSAACEELHSIFLSLPVAKRMAIISADREWLRSRTPRSSSSSSSRPLSRATQIALQRKMIQSDHSDSGSISSMPSSAGRSRRRSWATVENTSRPSSATCNTLTSNCEIIVGCLSPASAPVTQNLQRSASAGHSRKPWR